MLLKEPLVSAAVAQSQFEGVLGDEAREEEILPLILIEYQIVRGIAGSHEISGQRTLMKKYPPSLINAAIALRYTD